MAKPRVAGVVLAGGASSRMGRPKGLLPFNGEPLVARVLARLAPQVEALYLNANGADYAGFGVAVIPDAPASRGTGPMAGIAAARARARADGFDGLATVPCDAPFLPLDLVARLLQAGGAAYAVSPQGPEPVFALWPTAGEPAGASPRAALERLGASAVQFDDGEAFANVNTAEEFAAAERIAKMLEAGEPAMGRAPFGRNSS